MEEARPPAKRKVRPGESRFLEFLQELAENAEGKPLREQSGIPLLPLQPPAKKPGFEFLNRESREYSRI